VESGFVPDVGLYCELSHTFSHEEVVQFAILSGDNNPIHTDKAFAEKSIFKGTIVHGILLSSLFSTLFGRTVAGAVYVSQNLNFKRPVPVGAEVTARMEIVKMETKRKGILLTCATTCRIGKEEDGTVAIEGEARVLLMQ
jgi:3-hydroxybutyryl-CoA dehydratase